MEQIADLGVKKYNPNKRGNHYGIFLCPCCGNKVEKIIRDGLKAQYCSHACYAQKRKKRGPYKKKIINKKYIYLYAPGHPHAKGTKKLYVAEHRLVMEQKIGRYLTKTEVVHHINENTMDNRIENLMIMSISDHLSYHRKKEWRAKNEQ